MKHGSLFSGIGGFDLAAEWMGWQNVFHCEWNEFGQRVLKYYWPNAISYNDITKTDFTIHRGAIDILTGGFPCQPYSQAGKRLGKEDDRHLWPEMLRAIREIQPTWVVGENVLGLVNWNGGLVFHEVQTDLEAEGYEVQPYVLPAVSVNAPHRRDRVWFVAHAKCNGHNGNEIIKEGQQPNEWGQTWSQFTSPFESWPTTNTEGSRRKREYFCESWQIQSNGRNFKDATYPYDTRLQGRQNTRNNEEKKGQRKQCSNSSRYLCSNFRYFPTQSPICYGDDGLPTQLDGITFPKWRRESIKAGGNAIVPQVALQIFKSIEQYES